MALSLAASAVAFERGGRGVDDGPVEAGRGSYRRRGGARPVPGGAARRAPGGRAHGRDGGHPVRRRDRAAGGPLWLQRPGAARGPVRAVLPGRPVVPGRVRPRPGGRAAVPHGPHKRPRRPRRRRRRLPPSRGGPVRPRPALAPRRRRGDRRRHQGGPQPGAVGACPGRRELGVRHERRRHHLPEIEGHQPRRPAQFRARVPRPCRGPGAARSRATRSWNGCAPLEAAREERRRGRHEARP